MTELVQRFSLVAVMVGLLGSPVALMAGSSYYAVCRDASHEGGWKGHVYQVRERAQTEADEHNEVYTGHHAYVIGN